MTLHMELTGRWKLPVAASSVELCVLPQSPVYLRVETYISNAASVSNLYR